ncbi:hypothetical protein VTK56DRAFT_2745 [Thermocarpiscus australiensis]
MSSYNAYLTRKAASSVARGSSPWTIFPIFRRKSEPHSQTWQASNELEEQPLSPTVNPPATSSGASENTASNDPSPTTSNAYGRAPSTAQTQPETEASQHADAAGQGSTTGAGTVSQDAVRRRTSGKERSQDPAAEQSQEKQAPKKSRAFFKHIEPKEPFTVRNQIRRTLLNSWINVLLVAAPVGIAINFVPAVSRVAVFVVNFVAIVPLAGMLSFATEEIALRTGETMGGLLNATFGNAVELIVAVIALAHKEVVIVQTSLIGSILSNLLLVMGMCFFCGGLRRQEQYFNTTVAQTAASLLALAVAGVIVPTVFDIASSTPEADVAKLSRGTSVILLVVYLAYLFFQLKTHSKVFSEVSQKVEAKPFKRSLKDGAVAQGFVAPAGVMGGHGLISRPSDNERLRNLLTTPPRKNLAESEEADEGEEPQLHFAVAVATLTISTVIIAFCAEFMVDGISAVTAGGAVSAEFVGLILLPLVGNAAEHATAVTVAIKDKMDLAIGVAIGSSMQVALFIIPLLVIIGWGMGMDSMSLSFDPFQVAVLFVAVLLVNYLIADGKSHWLEGMLLMCLYCIIAVCSWWYPTVPEGGAE